MSEGCESQLEEFLSHPQFCGVRHIVQDEPDENFIVRPEVFRGLGVLERRRVPYDLLFYHQHLRHAVTVARAFPELRLVIDHLSKPRIREGVLEPWRSELRAAAAYPNVYCKLSGMVTEADWSKWTVANLRPYIMTAVEAFGPARCMYGSDWPVCELAADYGEVWRSLREVLSELSSAETAQIFGGTAAEFYGLKLDGQAVSMM
jgi:L-fuconolactonase